MYGFRKRIFWLGALFAIAGCSTPSQRKVAVSSVEYRQLVATARTYLLRDRPDMRITHRPPDVSYHATSVDGPPFWRVDFETITPAPTGYRIPPGTPTTRIESVYLDKHGSPFKRS